MTSGWHSDEHLILFEDPSEAIEMAQRYEIQERLPGYTLIGLRGWDDFILLSSEGQFHLAPTVPLHADKLSAWTMPDDFSSLEADPATESKIKWYITPLVFGGSPVDESNIAWVTPDQHVDLVRWWNNKYDEVKGL